MSDVGNGICIERDWYVLWGEFDTYISVKTLAHLTIVTLN